MSYSDAIVTEGCEPLNHKRGIVMLVMTEHCNLRCVYCYENKVDKSIMPLGVAQKAIIEAFANPETNEVEIDFFGGEPFVAFSRIIEIYEWVLSEPRPKPFFFFATTNGTLVHGKIQDWLRARKDNFIAALSLDGTPEMHDQNRSGSFKDIDLPFFRETWPFQAVKMTLSPQTLGDFAKGVVYIHSLGFTLTANPAVGLKWDDAHYSIYEEQLRILADYYLDNPEIVPFKILDMNLKNIAILQESGQSFNQNSCGSGKNMCAVDCKGNCYPCQTFLPMSGAVGDSEELFRLMKNDNNQEDPKCKDCPILAACQTCYGINFVANKNPYIKCLSDCMFSKVQAKATAYLWAGMLTNLDKGYAYLKDKTDTDRYLMVKAIERVHADL